MSEARTIAGHLPRGVADFVCLPVEVPPGVREIAVSYAYSAPDVPAGTPGNVCDIGLFDQRGHQLGGPGFRGWSGGARSRFAISAQRATPGYLAGPVEPGVWHVVLGPYTVAPQGMDYRITVTLHSGARGRTPEPVHPPQRVRGRGRAWYRGDCHLHTVHSDGERTPQQLVAAARAAGLDFINTSDHNTTSAHGAFGPLTDADPLVLTGEEVTTRGGHYLALGIDPGTWIDWRYRARDGAFDRFAELIRRAGGLVVPAHPYGACVACRWTFGYERVDAIEVWNGPWTADDELSLHTWDGLLAASAREGRGWTPALGSSDAHREAQVVGLPRTVVLADGLERFAVLDGLRAGHSWIAESAGVDLSFAAYGPAGQRAGIGDRLAVAPGDEVTVRLRPSGVPGAWVRLMTDQGELYRAPAAPVVQWRTTAARAAYVRAEVRHPSGGVCGLPGAMAALTNPIWLGGS